MATGKKQESDKERFRLCASPCPRFITGGDTQSVRCLYGSGARLIVFAFLCEHSTPGERSLRRALSPVLLAFPVSLSLRQSGA